MSKSIFKYISFLIIIIYIAAYITTFSGYYEYEMQQKTVITSDKIKEFEKDIADNKEIDTGKYLANKNYDYSNKFSNMVYTISDNSNKLARKVIKYLFNKLSALVDE